MPEHTDLHKEAAVNKKIRQEGIERQREIQTQKATERLKQKEKQDRGVTPVTIRIPVIPYKGDKDANRDWGEASRRSGG
tara:strand:+ start:71 stop:307 length:237 start_codon:yes stop_codon:yes gene_type:complete